MFKLFRVWFMVTLWVAIGQISIGQNISDQIRQLPGIISVEKMEQNAFFTEAWVIKVNQPLDHRHPELGSFPQRVILSNLGLDHPVVFITEGYTGDYGENSKYLNELCPLLHANQLFVEHRFFGQSVPDTLNWKYLTVENAAADHHSIVQLFKPLYGGKWISTGISKGGETTLYHRALYPKDVDLSVPYVAPLNYSVEEKRHDAFIRHKAGTASQRIRVRHFQIELLKRKSALMPLFEAYCIKNNFTFRADAREIYDYCVLEFSFSFWQWGTPVTTIPASSASDQKIFDCLIKVSSPDYFDIEKGKATLPFFVQAANELGYYGYNAKPFRRWMEVKDTKGYISKLFLPASVDLTYDPGMSLLVKDYLKNDAENILLIYGGNDPWIASAASTKGNKNIFKVVQPQGSHRTRIATMPDKQKRNVTQLLERWISK